MLPPPQAPGDLQLAVRGGGDGGGRVGGGQAGLAGEVPARRAGRRGRGASPSFQRLHTNGSLVTAEAQTRGNCSPKRKKQTENKIVAVQVRKDDVQTVVPISKSWSLMNTAVLTGRQVPLVLIIQH